MSYGFCSKFYSLSSSAILWISVKVWQSHRQLKGANFFETQCRLKWDQDFRGVATGLHSIKYRGAPLFKTRRLDKRLKIGKQKYAINVIYSRSRVVWQPGSLLWSFVCYVMAYDTRAHTVRPVCKYGRPILAGFGPRNFAWEQFRKISRLQLSFLLL